jgi:hypothetical protein
VIVSDEEDFNAERDVLLSSSGMSIEAGVPPATDHQVQTWLSANDKLVSTLDGKIAKLPTIASEAERIRFRELMLRRYLEGQETWEYLRRFPMTYEKLFAMKLGRERFIEAACMLHTGSNSDLLNKALAEFVAAIKEETKNIGLQRFTLGRHTALNAGTSRVYLWS